MTDSTIKMKADTSQAIIPLIESGIVSIGKHLVRSIVELLRVSCHYPEGVIQTINMIGVFITLLGDSRNIIAS